MSCDVSPTLCAGQFVWLTGDDGVVYLGYIETMDSAVVVRLDDGKTYVQFRREDMDKEGFVKSWFNCSRPHNYPDSFQGTVRVAKNTEIRTYLAGIHRARNALLSDLISMDAGMFKLSADVELLHKMSQT